jgi:hypothetical protein
MNKGLGIALIAGLALWAWNKSKNAAASTTTPGAITLPTTKAELLAKQLAAGPKLQVITPTAATDLGSWKGFVEAGGTPLPTTPETVLKDVPVVDAGLPGYYTPVAGGYASIYAAPSEFSSKENATAYEQYIGNPEALVAYRAAKDAYWGTGTSPGSAPAVSSSLAAAQATYAAQVAAENVAAGIPVGISAGDMYAYFCAQLYGY